MERPVDTEKKNMAKFRNLQGNWINFIKGASEILDLPKDDFKYSSNITSQLLCSDSYLKATANCPDSSIYTEYFIRGTEITEDCHIHGLIKNNVIDSRYSPNGKKRRGF